jgi:hypothetical protein
LESIPVRAGLLFFGVAVIVSIVILAIGWWRLR